MKARTESTAITKETVPNKERSEITNTLFGNDFPLKIEPTIYNICSNQALGYNGGYWEFYQLSNGGFYMAPNDQKTYQMSCPNYFQGELSADALGVMACLVAFSHLSFSKDLKMAKTCAQHFYLLREYVEYHPEAIALYGAID